MGRSQTAVPPPRDARPPPQGRRSLSQDSVLRAAAAADKAKGSAGRTRTGKKGSVHADVIDRLDFSGVGPMFHHDGPFDACAPSRNRHRTKAPMLAWTSTPPADQQALNDAYTPGGYESPYPASNPYESPYEQPKKKVDAIAEAWGIHEPEPYEEFFAGGGNGRHDESAPNSIYNGRERHGNDSSRGRRSGPRDGRQDGTPRRPPNPHKRSALPPPQPIFVPDTAENLPADPPSPQSAPGHGSGAGGINLPKRSRSLMQRIKKMRETPNVPVGYEDVPSGDGSPTSSTENNYTGYGATPQRPTHRSQNSFLGRFAKPPGNSTNAYGHPKDISPTFDGSDPYVYVDVPEVPGRGSTSVNREKSLPAAPLTDRTPSGSGSGDYFEGRGGDATTPGGSLGRKTSLLKKMRGVVRK
ncbi:hypothetical protein GLOTRDRAFT_32865 [Gloeophyllum trabeum ATCC 11539]|uniref:Pal1-domain-containing protein n=1 Tax=Gloeophyllum trabeum (strain ATCC 11539 / FP-39264 / Madison 617) TaxID=670483 RepID=S7RZU0_GLOTA|nr:uncharacterized protein GLOTRDRAFT_32865 [Gloeophyllum trabeum ATCC 11539]EPQ60560.1 hypothetical protein GLOTRDRAFT_32865 [Gloeophyllum trabeum ATCC 11539]